MPEPDIKVNNISSNTYYLWAMGSSPKHLASLKENKKTTLSGQAAGTIILATPHSGTPTSKPLGDQLSYVVGSSNSGFTIGTGNKELTNWTWVCLGFVIALIVLVIVLLILLWHKSKKGKKTSEAQGGSATEDGQAVPLPPA